MLHFSKISSQSKEFNLIASGALAFKIHNKILKDEPFQQGTKITRNMLLGNISSGMRISTGEQKKVFFVIISDLDKVNTESLCNMIAKERANGSYAVCQVIPTYYNEPSFKALKLLRQNFDEVLELNKLNLSGSKALNAEQQTCLLTDYSLSMARIMYHVCVNNFETSPKHAEAKAPEYAYA